jgi:hypothetical protein
VPAVRRAGVGAQQADHLRERELRARGEKIGEAVMEPKQWPQPRLEEHAEGCALVVEGPAREGRSWVGPTSEWEGDEQYCTCYLKAIMARRALYGDERLVGYLFAAPVLPFPVKH